MTDINEVLGNLNPTTKKKIQIASEMTEEKQELPSIGLTKILNGGLKYGTQNMFWGNKSSGKTLLALQTIALAQQAGKTAAFFDAEGSFTDAWGRKLGIDTDQLLVINHEKTFSGVTDKGVDLMQAGIDVMVIDSISALQPNSFFDKGELKAFDKTGQLGQHASDCSKMCSMFNLENEKTLLILISQVTNDIHPTYTQLIPHGGKKTGHLNTASIKLGSSLVDDKQIKGKVTEGNRLLEQNVGRPVNWVIEKDRGPGMGAKGSYDLYFAGDFIGVDTIGEIVDYGVKYGIIEQGGAWFTCNGTRLQGRNKVITYLKENLDVAESIRKEIVS